MTLAARWTLAAVAVAASLLAGCQSAPPWLQNGMVAPELAGTTVDGRTVRLSEQKGKVVALVFYADACPHCRGQYSTERDLAKRMEGGRFTLLGVDSGEDADVIREAMRRERITWPVIADPEVRIAKEWGVGSIPTTYVIDSSGVIRSFGDRGSSLVSTVDRLMAEEGSRLEARGSR